MTWPDDFVEIAATTIGTTIPAGGSVRVGPLLWTPTQVGHECLLAIVASAADPAVADIVPGPMNHGVLVRHDNNVGQRNVAPVAAVPGGAPKVSLWLHGGPNPGRHDVRVDAGALPDGGSLEVRCPRRLLATASIKGARVTSRTARQVVLAVAPGSIASFTDLSLPQGSSSALTLKVVLPKRVTDGAIIPIVITHDVAGEPAGRETIEISAVTEVAGRFFGNARSREVHVVDCPWWVKVSTTNKRPFASLAQALAHGYDGCATCLPDHDHG